MQHIKITVQRAFNVFKLDITHFNLRQMRRDSQLVLSQWPILDRLYNHKLQLLNRNVLLII